MIIITILLVLSALLVGGAIGMNFGLESSDVAKVPDEVVVFMNHIEELQDQGIIPEGVFNIDIWNGVTHAVMRERMLAEASRPYRVQDDRH